MGSVRFMKKNQQKSKIVAVSGGFDPIHIGHLRMFQEAKKFGDKLVVIVNNDNWLLAKKGYVYMPEKERKELIAAFPSVDKVVLTSHKKNDPDRSVCKELEKHMPHIFANGGDRTSKNTPEKELCKKCGIKMVYGLGEGGKIQSSSELTRKAFLQQVTTKRPWGEFRDWDGTSWHLKTIVVKKNSRLSLQSHRKREELWILVEGDAVAEIERDGNLVKERLVIGETIRIPKNTKHRLSSKKGATLVEIALGQFDESDIFRYEDDYNRI